MSSAPASRQKVFGVSEITRLVKGTLERAFGEVCIEGELSNVRRPGSGHYYFTLKDESAQISAVLFRGSQRGLTFELRDGLLVRATGELTVYERGGNYQVIVRRIEEGGKGALQAQFEALKEKLQKEGLFDEGRKRPLPLLPQHVGIVTSQTGAAVRDILNVLTRRFPNIHVVLAPASVQGERAAGEVAAAIDALNEVGGIDVMIVGRGGGSLEDLWCFNEESVARAIARSSIPVISAVGHEIDFTISDFVADLRAPTPSAAAELVVGRKDAFDERLDSAALRIGRSLKGSVLEARARLQASAGSPVFQEPRNAVLQYLRRLESLGLMMEHGLERRLQEYHQQLDDLGVRATHCATLCHHDGEQDVKRMSMQLAALSPLAVLQRGYSVTTDAGGKVVRSVADVRAGSQLDTRVADGSFRSAVTGVASKNAKEGADHDGKTTEGG